MQIFFENSIMSQVSQRDWEWRKSDRSSTNEGTVHLLYQAEFFEAIKAGNSDKVRALLSADKSLTTVKQRGDYKFETDLELDAYKFLGAYMGSLTGLQVAILVNQETIAKDIIDATFQQGELNSYWELDSRY